MLDLWTTVWGKKTQAYLEVMLPSLLQPGNIPAAREYIHTYTFYTNDEAREKIERSRRYKELEALVPVLWMPLQKGEWEVNSNTLHQMRRSAEEGHYMMVCSPDDVVGDDSIANLIQICQGGFNPILYHLPRVRPGTHRILKHLLRKGTVSNRALVSLTIKYLFHKHSAYPIFPVGDHWEAWHPTPTPILRPDQRVVDIFATNWGKNWGYDNCLPYIMIELEYPWCLIPHSDIYFHIEIGGSSIGPNGLPINSPCCTWMIDKARATVLFFSPHRYPNKHLRTIWQGLEKPAAGGRYQAVEVTTEKVNNGHLIIPEGVAEASLPLSRKKGQITLRYPATAFIPRRKGAR